MLDSSLAGMATALFVMQGRPKVSQQNHMQLQKKAGEVLILEDVARFRREHLVGRWIQGKKRASAKVNASEALITALQEMLRQKVADKCYIAEISMLS